MIFVRVAGSIQPHLDMGDGWVHDVEKVATLKAEFRRAKKPKCCMVAAMRWGLQGFDMETSVRLGLAGHDLLMHGYPVPRPEGKS